MSVFSNLPHALIREIVKEADGGLNTHKKKFQATLDNLNHGGDAITGYKSSGSLIVPDTPIFLHEWGQGNETGLYGYDVDEDDDSEWMERQEILFGEEYGYGRHADEYFEDDYCGVYYSVGHQGREVYEGMSLERAKRVASSTGQTPRFHIVIDGEFQEDFAKSGYPLAEFSPQKWVPILLAEYGKEEAKTLTRCGVGDTNVWSPKGCNCVLDEEEAELIDDYRGYCYYCKDCYESDTD